MHLEHALRQIQTDRRNLHVDGPLGDSFQQFPYGTSMPGPGAVHLIKSGARSHLYRTTVSLARTPQWSRPSLQGTHCYNPRISAAMDGLGIGLSGEGSRLRAEQG
jgi:hypothetical protein